jgi:hypothetical protein
MSIDSLWALASLNATHHRRSQPYWHAYWISFRPPESQNGTGPRHESPSSRLLPATVNPAQLQLVRGIFKRAIQRDRSELDVWRLTLTCEHPAEALVHP